MQYREIVAVTGLSGLYQLMTTKSDGAVVRSLADNSTKFISARQHHVTPLDSIEVYTTADNIRLYEVFLKMAEKDESNPAKEVNTNDNKAIKAYFGTVLPEFDEDRVYVSDMKKMIKWFEIIKNKGLLEQMAADMNQPGEESTEETQQDTTE